jgi:Icc protein
MLIAQLSDLHITRPDDPAFGRIDTNSHTVRAIEHLNTVRPRPDCVVIKHLDHLDMPCHLAPGNHDDRDVMREHVRGPWNDQPSDGYLHYAVDVGPLRLIGLDSLVPGEARGELSPDRLDWLATVLDADPHRPTVLFLHHPPFTTGIHAMDAIGLTGADALADLVARHSQVVSIWCGHTHRSMSTTIAQATATCYPSVAHSVALDLLPNAPLCVSLDPPGFQLHRWQGERFLTHTGRHPPGHALRTLRSAQSAISPM